MLRRPPRSTLFPYTRSSDLSNGFARFRLPVMVERAAPYGTTSRRRDGRMPLIPFKDRKSTRLNSSHANISYAVFCLKKKKKSKSNYDPQTQQCVDVHDIECA